VGYILIYDDCGGDEVGETGQNVYTRVLSHMTKYQEKRPDFPLWKHSQMAHGGDKAVSFSIKVVKSFRDPLTRHIDEAVRISNCIATTQLNSKTATVGLVAEGDEWGKLRVWQNCINMKRIISDVQYCQL
jgi:hypothetical protein